ncbi:cyclin 11 [Angomonas deanei]|nr:cyclin 11 [Angomonas deanei]|eukprot:EPY41544.1 cyclin 11 [Angomonas deanei]
MEQSPKSKGDPNGKLLNNSGYNGNSKSQPPLHVGRMVVTLHGLFDMPRAMAQVDPRYELFEIVLRPQAKYYFRNKMERFTTLELPEQHIKFSPSVIFYRNDRFVLDFDSLCGQSRTVSPFHHGSSVNSIFSNSANDPLLSQSQSLGLGVRDSCESVGYEEDASASKNRKLNTVVLEYPTREDLKVIIQVYVCMRSRPINSTSSFRWITPNSKNDKLYSHFAAAEGEVARRKVVNRFLGLTVGHLSCTMSLPNVQDDLRLVADSSTAMHAAVERLKMDCQRLLELSAPAGKVDLPSPDDIRRQLGEGTSEWTIYQSILLAVDPQYFIKRVSQIQQMYPPGGASLDWVSTPAEELVAENKGMEEDLIRRLCVELGPEPNSISPRVRKSIYCWFYDINEDDVESLTQGVEDMLDHEPDLFIQRLAERYGKEMQYTRFGTVFPLVQYIPDERTYFLHCLRFPSSNTSVRDEILRERQVRVPLQVTPNERPLEPRNMSEMDLLKYKYKPEFQQILPPLIEAMEIVAQNNSNLLAQAHIANHKEFDVFVSNAPFHQYSSVLSRLAGDTYISPSSLLSAFIYMDRLAMRYPTLYITTFNIERLLVTAVRIASKVVDLRNVNNRGFATALHLSTTDLNQMEERMVMLMNFDFFYLP